jgi:hypothetical protein
MHWTLALSALDSLPLSAIDTIPNAVPNASALNDLKVSNEGDPPLYARGGHKCVTLYQHCSAWWAIREEGDV